MSFVSHDYVNDIPDITETTLKHINAEVCLFNHNGTLCCIGTTDAIIILYDITTKSDNIQLYGHKGSIVSVSWSRSGRYLLSVDDSGLIIQWNIYTLNITSILQLNNYVKPTKIIAHPRNKDIFIVTTHNTEPLYIQLIDNDNNNNIQYDVQYTSITPIQHPSRDPIIQLPLPAHCIVHELKLDPLYLVPDFGLKENNKIKNSMTTTTTNKDNHNNDSMTIDNITTTANTTTITDDATMQATDNTNQDVASETTDRATDGNISIDKDSKITQDSSTTTTSNTDKIKHKANKKITTQRSIIAKTHYNISVIFDLYGDSIILGSNQGWISVYNTSTLTLQYIFPIAINTSKTAPRMYTSMSILQLTMSRQGNKLAANCQPTKSGGYVIKLFGRTQNINNNNNNHKSISNNTGNDNIDISSKNNINHNDNNIIDLNQWQYIREYRDPVAQHRWLHASFNGSSDHLVSTTQTQNGYSIHIWNSSIYDIHDNLLLSTLEFRAPDQRPTDLTIHPYKSLYVIPLDPSGSVYFYNKQYMQNWTSFAPKFEELTNNEEYVEKEDEFDIKQDINNDELLYGSNVDIITVDNNKSSYYVEPEPDALDYLPLALTQDENVAKRVQEKISEKHEIIKQNNSSTVTNGT